jgi:hypothetical protein
MPPWPAVPTPGGGCADRAESAAGQAARAVVGRHRPGHWRARRGRCRQTRGPRRGRPARATDSRDASARPPTSRSPGTTRYGGACASPRRRCRAGQGRAAEPLDDDALETVLSGRGQHPVRLAYGISARRPSSRAGRDPARARARGTGLPLGRTRRDRNPHASGYPAALVRVGHPPLDDLPPGGGASHGGFPARRHANTGAAAH